MCMRSRILALGSWFLHFSYPLSIPASLLRSPCKLVDLDSAVRFAIPSIVTHVVLLLFAASTQPQVVESLLSYHYHCSSFFSFSVFSQFSMGNCNQFKGTKKFNLKKRVEFSKWDLWLNRLDHTSFYFD